MFVAGVDGCRTGWVWFKAEVPSDASSAEVIDLPRLLRDRPGDLAYLGIDISIGLLDAPRACDIAARKIHDPSTFHGGYHWGGHPCARKQRPA